MELYDAVCCIKRTSVDIHSGGDGFIAHPDSIRGDFLIPVLMDKASDYGHSRPLTAPLAACLSGLNPFKNFNLLKIYIKYDLPG